MKDEEEHDRVNGNDKQVEGDMWYMAVVVVAVARGEGVVKELTKNNVEDNEYTGETVGMEWWKHNRVRRRERTLSCITAWLRGTGLVDLTLRVVTCSCFRHSAVQSTCEAIHPDSCSTSTRCTYSQYTANIWPVLSRQSKSPPTTSLEYASPLLHCYVLPPQQGDGSTEYFVPLPAGSNLHARTRTRQDETKPGSCRWDQGSPSRPNASAF